MDTEIPLKTKISLNKKLKKIEELETKLNWYVASLDNVKHLDYRHEGEVDFLESIIKDYKTYLKIYYKEAGKIYMEVCYRV